MVRDLIVVASIAALASSLIVLGSGYSFFFSLSDSQLSLRFTTIVRVGSLEGTFMLYPPSLVTYVMLLVPSASLETEQGLRTVATQASSLLSLLFLGSSSALRVLPGNGLYLMWRV